MFAIAAAVATSPGAAHSEPNPPLLAGARAGFASGTDGGSFDDGSVSMGIDALYRVHVLLGGDLSVGGDVSWARWESRVDRSDACWDPVTGGLRLVGACPAGDIPVDIEREYVRSSWLVEALVRWHTNHGPFRPYAQLGIGAFRLRDYFSSVYRNQQDGVVVRDDDGASYESGLVMSLGIGFHVPITEMLLLGAGIEQHTQRRPGDESPYFEYIRILTLRVTTMWQ